MKNLYFEVEWWEGKFIALLEGLPSNIFYPLSNVAWQFDYPIIERVYQKSGRIAKAYDLTNSEIEIFASNRIYQDIINYGVYKKDMNAKMMFYLGKRRDRDEFDMFAKENAPCIAKINPGIPYVLRGKTYIPPKYNLIKKLEKATFPFDGSHRTYHQIGNSNIWQARNDYPQSQKRYYKK